MKFIKHQLAALPCCYATTELSIDGRTHYLFATDDTGPCYCFDAETGERETVWEQPGGTMSLVPLPGLSGAFLASRKFLPGFTALEAEIVLARRAENGWKVEHWMDLPYVHRFDILERNGRRYFLGCILSSTDKPYADWDCPGYLVAAPMDATFAPPQELERIAEGMHRNHGYWKFQKDGHDCALTACDEGIFTATPPEVPGKSWQVERILDVPASDAVFCDIDGDGVDEMAVISPFHGTDFLVYKKGGNGYQEIYRHPEKMDFLHAIWGGELAGEPVFVGGFRALEQSLFLLHWRDEAMRAETIEIQGGPSNVAVVRSPQGDRLLVANREAAQAAVFDVTE